jgi:hypothetical protein
LEGGECSPASFFSRWYHHHEIISVQPHRGAGYRERATEMENEINKNGGKVAAPTENICASA